MWTRLLTLALAACPLASQPAVEYELSFPNAGHHEAEVEVTWRGVDTAELEVCLSETSPGRYAVHHFSKNLHALAAFDGAGRELTARRVRPYSWSISGHDGTVRVTYRLYGDLGDGTYNQIDTSHAHLNGPPTYLWARGLETRPVRVRFHPPPGSGWNVATQLRPTEDAFSFTALNRDYLLDSPAELSRFETREWPLEDGGRRQTIRLAVHHTGTPSEVDRFADSIRAFIAEEIAVFGELPAFDFGMYTFLLDYVPWASGDGMEHRNSTYCTSPGTLAGDSSRLINTAAHEFFHAWNVERLRPSSLEPFDFERANISGELWFAEGFTTYYAGLVEKRAGLVTFERFTETVGATLSEVARSPGRRHLSPVGASMFASLSDGAAANEPVNDRNMNISYYPYGAAVALGLDLTLRTRFDASLDDYMRLLWERHGRSEQPYTMRDLQEALARVTGNGDFAAEFIRRHVFGSDLPDFTALLERAGLAWSETAEPGCTLGHPSLSFGRGGASVTSATIQGTPLYDAGIDRGATILRVDGKQIATRKRWDDLLRKKRPGGILELEVEDRGVHRNVRVAAKPCSSLRLRTFEAVGRTVTPEVRAFREAWLGPRASQAPSSRTSSHRNQPPPSAGLGRQSALVRAR